MKESSIPAAQYLRMSTESQDSLQFQQSVISAYADKMNFHVVKTYTDPGKSGLGLEDGRWPGSG